MMRCAVLLVTLVLVLLAPARATAAPSDGDARRKEAQTFFEKGVKLEKEGDSKAALVAFRAAYVAYPSFRVLYNVGQLCGRMGDNACAVRAYEQYLRDGGADVPAPRRESVEAELRGLSRTVGLLSLRSNAVGDEVRIDDEPVGRMPIAEPVPVNAGTHKVVLVHDKRSVEQTVKVASGETAIVQLDVPPEESAAPPALVVPPVATTPAPTGEAAPSGRKVPVVPWVITGVLVAATAVSGILAASAYGSYQDKRETFPVTRDELDDAQGSARNLFVLTSVLGAATVISAGVAGYFTFWPRPRTAAGTGTRVGFAAGPGGVSIVGVLP